MRKTAGVLWALIFLVTCSSPAFAGSITALSDIATAKVGVPKGTLADSVVLDKFPQAHIVSFASTKECVEALKSGDIDAVVYDEPVLRKLAAGNPTLAVLKEFIRKDLYAFAINPKRADLKELVDAKIREMKSKGILSNTQDRWFGARAQGVMPKVMLPVRGKKLVMGTFVPVEPFVFRDAEKKLAGYDIELAYTMAKAAHMGLLIKEMPFEQLIPAVASGKLDMAAACLTVTPEREQSVLFSEPYYRGGVAVLVKK